MIGYHYTTNVAWKSIRIHGLVPQLSTRSPFGNSSWIKLPPKITWLFIEPAKSEVEARGQILLILAKGNNLLADYVLELEVKYNKKHLAPIYKTIAKDEMLKISHVGSIGTTIGTDTQSFDYHSNRQSVILTRRVPPQSIRIYRSWKVLIPISGLVDFHNAHQIAPNATQATNADGLGDNGPK